MNIQFLLAVDLKKTTGKDKFILMDYSNGPIVSSLLSSIHYEPLVNIRAIKKIDYALV